MSSTSQWEKTWAKVIKDPLDFSSWEALVKLAEGVKSFQDQDKQNLRTVYDHFLQKFPLLFGYWKKYADWETQMAGIEAAIAVYERGVASVHNSVDLWVFYLSYKMEKAFKSPEETRELFERGNHTF
jgi:pre-mRNA-processing factor 39